MFRAQKSHWGYLNIRPVSQICGKLTHVGGCLYNPLQGLWRLRKKRLHQLKQQHARVACLDITIVIHGTLDIPKCKNANSQGLALKSEQSGHYHF